MIRLTTGSTYVGTEAERIANGGFVDGTRSVNWTAAPAKPFWKYIL